MRKKVFSVMLSLSVMGGIGFCPIPAMASVTQVQTIKVKSQIVDQIGRASCRERV